MQFAVPSTIHGLMAAFHRYRSDVGLPSILDYMDWDGVQPQQIYASVLNRRPEEGEAAALSANLSMRRLYEVMLNSDEFQRSIMRLLLEAFPDKRRIIFVHIMKCAGTDLIGHLSKRYPHLYRSVSEAQWTPRPHLFSYLRDFSLAASESDEIFLSGHVDLMRYLDSGVCRPGDEVFTIVRNPIGRLLSMVNYVCGILADLSAPLRPDRQLWLKMLGEREIPADAGPDWLRGLARRVLRNKLIIAPNVLCHSLGRGDASSAFEAIVRSNIEITDARRYEAWLKARWDVAEPSEKLNASRGILTAADLSDADVVYINEILAEDFVLYDLISRRLAETDALSIRGQSLVAWRAEAAA